MAVGCTNAGGGDYYYVGGIRISCNNNGGSVLLYHGTYVTYGAFDPYPTLTGPTTCSPIPLFQSIATRTIGWLTTPTLKIWDYVIGGQCTAECNTYTDNAVVQCRSGTLTATGDTSFLDIHGALVPYTVTAVLAAAA